ncbi:MAG: FkbM family methyltransferase [Phascolarctobacterium faecium]
MQAVDIDTLLEDERVTYIKMDVEGAEMEALKGGKEQINVINLNYLLPLIITMRIFSCCHCLCGS